jgi:hypothetical protein
VLLAVAPGCNCKHVTGLPPCTAETETEAQTQVQQALAGNTACVDAGPDAGSDCVLVQTACKVSQGSCSFDFAAVSLAGQAAVEHAFSITAAEVCGACTPTPGGEGGLPPGEPACEFNSTPAAACVDNECTVVAVPPDAGSCLPGPDGQTGCEFGGEVCNVQAAQTPCPGLTYYFALNGSGSCMPTDVGSSCELGFSDCDGTEVCADAGSGSFGEGVCILSCPDPSVRPPGCDGGCELIVDQSGCNLCLCRNGCPVPDAG